MKVACYLMISLICCIFLFSSCVKEYSYERGPVDSAAIFILNCNAASLQGNYIKNTSLTSANIISLSVNVAGTGSWRLSTVAVNGMSFAGSGRFTDTGIQKITLKGTGKPLNKGDFTVVISGNGPMCSVRITVVADDAGAPGGNADYDWEFTEGGRVIKGNFIAASLITPPGSNVLGANGAVSSGDSSLSMYMTDVSSDITAYESYSSLNPSSKNRFTFDFSKKNAGSSLYQAGLGGNNPADMTATIVSIDKTAKTAQGIFAGTARDENGILKYITDGRFKVKYN